MQRYSLIPLYVLLLFIIHDSINVDTAVAQTPLLKEGFPVTIGTHPVFKAHAGPVAADIDGDGELEIVMNSGRFMHVIKADGSEAEGFPASADHVMQFSPSVGDLDGDGSLEIVAQARLEVSPFSTYYIYAWHSDGSRVDGFPVSFGKNLSSSPVLFDFDNDGKLEIIAEFEDKLYVLDNTGAIMPGWPVTLGLYIDAKPAVGDIDGDGIADIVVANFQRDRDTQELSGTLFAFNFFGGMLAGFPVDADTLFGFARTDPMLIDIDLDGSFEIAISMRTSIPNGAESKTLIIDGDGTEIRRWNTGVANHRLSAGDLDDDGSPDILSWSVDSIYAHSTTLGVPLQGWPAVVDTNWAEYEGVIGDIDSTLGLELVRGTASTIFDEGWLWGNDFDGSLLPWSALRPKGFMLSSPLLTDLEGDGTVDIVLHSNSHEVDTKSFIYAYEVPGSSYDPDQMPWPMYGHDRYHTSQYGFVPTDSVIVSVTEEDDAVIANDYALMQNYPNPFNPETRIDFALPEAGRTRIIIYDLLGKEVIRLVDREMSEGYHSVNWNAINVASGIYFYKLISGDFTRTKKLLLLK